MRRPALFAAAALAAVAADAPGLKTTGPVETYGRHLQRTMTLLATSTPERRNTVRVLFYGQSITEQKWAKAVADDLRKRFPHAHLVVENRAIGGHSSQLLVKAAEADLYPFYPDLLIFHVYGAHDDYERIVRRVRERTTAEVLMQTDHLNANDDPGEETDPATLSPMKWSQWMNYSFLPGVARKYGCELADQRNLWKAYLKDSGAKPADLLTDNVHLNDRGSAVMADVVKLYLRHDPAAPADWSKLVTDTPVGPGTPTAGPTRVEFDGNRVDLVLGPGTFAPAAVTIDGKKPSEFPGCYAKTRATAYPKSKWPCLLRVGNEKPLAVEDWTVTLTEIPDDLKRVKFTVAGSKTGPDGEGVSGERFVSPSGRVAIEPGDWNLEYCRKVFKRPLAAPFAVEWKVVPLFADEVAPPAEPPAGVERVVTVAQGLPNGKHTLDVPAGVPLKAVRAYRPPPTPD